MNKIKFALPFVFVVSAVWAIVWVSGDITQDSSVCIDDDIYTTTKGWIDRHYGSSGSYKVTVTKGSTTLGSVCRTITSPGSGDSFDESIIFYNTNRATVTHKLNSYDTNDCSGTVNVLDIETSTQGICWN